MNGKIVRIEHIGSVQNDTDLALLTAFAKERLKAGQQSLLEPEPTQTIQIRQSVSSVLLDVFRKQYDQLSFDGLHDEDFRYLCIDRNRLQGCLKRVITQNYRDTLAILCFAHASQGVGITLILYDVTTLYVEVQKEDNFRKPGMSKEWRLEPQIMDHRIWPCPGSLP